jgi:hypothetical protein
VESESLVIGRLPQVTGREERKIHTYVESGVISNRCSDLIPPTKIARFSWEPG